MQHDQPTATLAVALPGHGYMTEAAEAAAGMEIDTNDGTVADASMLPPGPGAHNLPEVARPPGPGCVRLDAECRH